MPDPARRPPYLPIGLALAGLGLFPGLSVGLARPGPDRTATAPAADPNDPARKVPVTGTGPAQ